MYDNETTKLINELDKQAKEIQAKIDELKNNNVKKNVRWRAKGGEGFYIVSERSNVGHIEYKMTEDFGACCDFHYKTGNYFKTYEEAKKRIRNLLTTQKIKDIALRLNNGEEIDFSNHDSLKYHIGYHYSNSRNKEELGQDSVYELRYLNQIYCLSNKFLETCIKEIGEAELIEYIKEC